MEEEGWREKGKKGEGGGGRREREENVKGRTKGRMRGRGRETGGEIGGKEEGEVLCIGACRAAWVPGQDLAMPNLMRNCINSILSLYCTLYACLCTHMLYAGDHIFAGMPRSASAYGAMACQDGNNDS